MTWFRVDDAFYRGKKVRKLGHDRVTAVGLWSLCGVWSADNLTDGFVPWEVVDEWDPKRRYAQALIRVTLWYETEHDGELGIQFHDWGDWQPTRDQVIQRRKVEAERKARWRDKRAEHPGTDDPVTQESRQVSRRDNTRDETRDSHRESHPESHDGPVLPDPTRPDPSISTADYVDQEQSPPVARHAAKRRTGERIPDGFPNPEAITWARQHTPHANLAHEAEQFRDYWSAKAGKDATKIDWMATWRRWVRTAEERAPRATNGRVHRSTTDERVAGWQALKHQPEREWEPRAIQGGLS